MSLPIQWLFQIKRHCITLIIAELFWLGAAAQVPTTNAAEEQAVLQKVNQFFEALDKQDSVLFKSIVYADGQSWAVRPQADSFRVNMRSFEDRIRKFVNPAAVIQEKLLSYEIKIHQQIAMAWVPYELSLSGQFSHCGVDVFTLLKTKEGWKITTIAFTVEPEGCDALKGMSKKT